MSDVRAIAQRELAERELARRNFLEFVKKMNPGYMAGWVHEEVANELQAFYEAVKRKESPRLAIYMPPRTGKQIAHDTPILTTQGWKTHGELQVGDRVFHPSGKPVRVLALSPEAPNEFKVVMTNGAEVVCHGNHEWTVFNRAKHKWATYETRAMFEGLPIRAGRKQALVTGGKLGERGSRCTFQLPNLEGPLQMDEQFLPVAPYAFGAWLGDGSLSKACVTTPDREVVEGVNADGYETSSVYVHSITRVPTTYFCGSKKKEGKLTSGLKEAGVFKTEKYIPDIYLRSSVRQRLELLAGLIDTDGHVCPETARVTYSTTSERLKDTTVDLVRSLGFRPYIMEEEPKTSTSGVVGRKKVWIVGFQPTMDIPTRVARKQVHRVVSQRRIAIAKIEPCTSGMGRCIQVDSPDGLYLVGRELIPTHNSLLSSINFPAWVLGQDPTLDIVIASYAAGLSSEFSKKTREMFREPEYTSIFPKTRLHKDMSAVEAWKTTELGGYTAVGVGGGLTGKGADILTLDDLYSDREDAESEAYRNRVRNWFTSTAYTRLMPGGGVLVLFTRWHEDDLGGYIETLEHEDFKVIRYPAIAVEDETNRKEGEALHPERYDETALKRIKASIGLRDWNSLYQQNPVPAEGDLFKAADFKYYDQEPPHDEMAVMVAWDLSTGKATDYSAGIVAGVDRKGDLYVLKVVRKRMTAIELVDTIIDVAVEYKAQVSGLEVGQIASTIEPMLEKRMNERREFIRLEKLKPGRVNKVGRAMNILARIEQGKVFFKKRAEWLADFEEELLKFPNGKNDDMVDSFAYLGYMINMVTPPQQRPPKKKKSWKDDIHKYLNKGKGGGGYLTA